jgi:pentose-5-phosphate-3-epimerase
LRPRTPFSAVEPFLENLDLLLVMTVEPGFGGQPFMQEMLEKVRAAAAFRAAHNLQFRIEVDGGINVKTAGPRSRPAQIRWLRALPPFTPPTWPRPSGRCGLRSLLLH